MSLKYDHLVQACVDAMIMAHECVSVDFASDSMVVLTGALIVREISAEEGFVNHANPFIWWVVELLNQNLGYELHTAELTGQGSQGNPHKWYIVMIKEGAA